MFGKRNTVRLAQDFGKKVWEAAKVAGEEEGREVYRTQTSFEEDIVASLPTDGKNKEQFDEVRSRSKKFLDHGGKEGEWRRDFKVFANLCAARTDLNVKFNQLRGHKQTPAEVQDNGLAVWHQDFDVVEFAELVNREPVLLKTPSPGPADEMPRPPRKKRRNGPDDQGIRPGSFVYIKYTIEGVIYKYGSVVDKLELKKKGAAAKAREKKEKMDQELKTSGGGVVDLLSDNDEDLQSVWAGTA
eukprot:930393-Rhodomonas_salina.1